MKKTLLILGILIIVISSLFIIFRLNKNNKLGNINSHNFEIKYGTIDKWVDSGINAKTIKKVNIIKEENQYKIEIILDKSSQQTLKEITSNNIGKQIGIFIRSKVVSAPTIKQIIDIPSIIISNNFNEEEALVFKNDILNEIPDPSAFYTIKPIGKSMEEYGNPEGQNVKIYYNQKCVPGDNCSFQCLAEKCVCPPGDCVSDGGNEFLAIKRLISINNDCYWFEGNYNSRIEGNTEYTSFDSRTYGCLMPSEFRMNGVAK